MAMQRVSLVAVAAIAMVNVGAAAGSAWAGLPANVRLLHRNVGEGLASPDGGRFVFNGIDGSLRVHVLATGRTTTIAHLGSVPCEFPYAWSSSGDLLAYTTENGLYVLDVKTQQSRQVDPVTTCTFAFDRTALLFIKDRAVRREGTAEPLTTVPELANELHFTAPLGADSVPHLVAIRRTDPAARDATGLYRLWVVDLASARTTLLFQHPDRDGPVGELHVSPSARRICYEQRGVRCMALPSGQVTIVHDTPVTDLVWGSEEDNPFSPSEQQVLVPHRVGTKDWLMLFDLTTGQSRDLVTRRSNDDGYPFGAFLDETHVLLFNGAALRSVPMLESIDLDTGKRRALFFDGDRDRMFTGYTRFYRVHGRLDIVFMARARSVARDMVSIRLR